MNVFTLDVGSRSRLEELTKLLRNALDQIYERRRENSAVVLRCESTAASSFVDESIQNISAWEKALRQLEVSQAIIIFMSNGDAFGHAFDLLLISDFRIVGRDSKIGFGLQNSLIRPGMSLYRLANQIGQARSRQVGLTGRAFSAEESCSLGLADEIADNGNDLLSPLLKKLDDLPSSELALRRRLLLEAHAMDYDNALGAHLAACARGHPGSCE